MKSTCSVFVETNILYIKWPLNRITIIIKTWVELSKSDVIFAVTSSTRYYEHQTKLSFISFLPFQFNLQQKQTPTNRNKNTLQPSMRSTGFQLQFLICG